MCFEGFNFHLFDSIEETSFKKDSIEEVIVNNQYSAYLFVNDFDCHAALTPMILRRVAKACVEGLCSMRTGPIFPTD